MWGSFEHRWIIVLDGAMRTVDVHRLLVRSLSLRVDCERSTDPYDARLASDLRLAVTCVPRVDRQAPLQQRSIASGSDKNVPSSEETSYPA